MRFDVFMLFLAILLLAAIVLTLLFGKEHGRHGYGDQNTGTPGQDSYADGPLGPPLQNREATLCPRINPTAQVVELGVTLAGQVIDGLGAARAHGAIDQDRPILGQFSDSPGQLIDRDQSRAFEANLPVLAGRTDVQQIKIAALSKNCEGFPGVQVLGDCGIGRQRRQHYQ